jgi:hypothetical protein
MEQKTKTLWNSKKNKNNMKKNKMNISEKRVVLNFITFFFNAKNVGCSCNFYRADKKKHKKNKKK